MTDRQCFYCKVKVPDNEVLHAALVTEMPLCDNCAEEVGCACMCYDVNEEYERVIITKEVKPLFKEITGNQIIFERQFRVYPETIRRTRDG